MDKALRERLVQVYPTEVEVRRVLHDAGVATANLEFGSTIRTSWHHALQLAHNLGKLDRVREVLDAEYPQDELQQLREAVVGATGFVFVAGVLAHASGADAAGWEVKDCLDELGISSIVQTVTLASRVSELVAEVKGQRRPRAAIWVVPDSAEVRDFFANANQLRDRIAGELSCPLIILMDDAGWSDFRQRAVDLWSVHTRVVRFSQSGVPAPKRLELPSSALNAQREALLSLAKSNGLTDDTPFKLFLVHPTGPGQTQLPLTTLAEFERRFALEISGYGGESFPYDALGRGERRPIPNGVQLVYAAPWPFESRGLRLWRVMRDGAFGQLNLIHEDWTRNLGRDRLVIQWAILDVVRALTFAERWSRELRRPVGFEFEWTQLQDRTLDPGQTWVAARYQNYHPTWRHSGIITAGAEVRGPIVEALDALFWLFGWAGWGKSWFGTDFLNGLLAGRWTSAGR